MKLIAIGDNVTDCYIDEKIYFPGGNALNVAVNCKKNGAERVNYIGIFGDDERAEYIKQCLTEEGVTFERSRKVYAPTAQPRVYLKDGDRVFAPGIRDSCQHLFAIRIVAVWNMNWKGSHRFAGYRLIFLIKKSKSIYGESVHI